MDSLGFLAVQFSLAHFLPQFSTDWKNTEKNIVKDKMHALTAYVLYKICFIVVCYVVMHVQEYPSL